MTSDRCACGYTFPRFIEFGTTPENAVIPVREVRLTFNCPTCGQRREAKIVLRELDPKGLPS